MSELKKKVRTACILLILVAIITLLIGISLDVMRNLTAQIISLLALLFGVLGVAGFLKPETYVPIALKIVKLLLKDKDKKAGNSTTIHIQGNGNIVGSHGANINVGVTKQPEPRPSKSFAGPSGAFNIGLKKVADVEHWEINEDTKEGHCTCKWKADALRSSFEHLIAGNDLTVEMLLDYANDKRYHAMANVSMTKPLEKWGNITRMEVRMFGIQEQK